MIEFLTRIFDTTGFPARWRCGQWTDAEGWLHIISDLSIWGAYTAIPVVIGYFVLKRKDVPFSKIFWLFGAFILACGSGHLLEAIIFWNPVYRLSGLVKLFTAVVSWGTVIALVRVTPEALRLPGLASLNNELTREVQERKEAEQQLRQGEERFRLALVAGGMGSWEWKIAENEVVWSAELEAIHGLAPGTLPTTFAAFQSDMHPDDRERVGEQLQRTLKQGIDHHVEYRIVLGKGQIRWVEGRGKLFRDARGKPERISGVCTDITDRKAAEQERERLLESERIARSEAERASRVKDEFLSLVSHELRTPLTAILGYAQLLRRDGSNPVDVKQAAEVIERNGRAQAQIIEDLLDMSRIISGKMRLDVQSIDVCEVIQAAVQTVRPAAQAKDIHLHTVLDPRAGRVLGDPGRLQQVIWNLLSNAIKFTPKQGRVQVLLERVNSHVELHVSDTGPGISPEFLPYVFDRFRQQNATSSRQHGGLGLGLSLVKHLVEQHGGTVSVRSDGDGKGSTFTVTLPVQIVHIDERDESRIHPTSENFEDLGYKAPAIAGLKILVVDDESDARALMKRLLEEHGVIVITAEGAEEGMQAIREQMPDVVVSDIGMPVTDGYQFIRNVRALSDREGGRVPAAAATAFARSEDRTRALLAGFQAHVTKPVNPNELIAVVAALAGRTGR